MSFSIKQNIMVTQSSIPEFSEYCEEIKDVWETHQLTNNGGKHQEFESMLKNRLGVNNLTLFTNGHLALHTAIKSLHLKGEVITTPYTFISTANAIVENGLVPVFCDIESEFYTIDTKKIEKLINENTCAILPVHVYGNICDVEELEKISKKYNIPVIYDAAHIFGVKYKGISACSFGEFSMMSFHATKVFNTIEGGALVYKKNYYDKLNALKNFGLDNDGDCFEEGINAKMNEFQACMGICNLRHIDSEIAKRKKVVERYNSNLSLVESIKLPPQQKDVDSNYAYYPILIKDECTINRDDLFLILEGEGIFSRKYFYPIISEFDFYKNSGYTDNTPTAKYVSEHILTLPLYADLSIKDIDRICSIIKESIYKD